MVRSSKLFIYACCSIFILSVFSNCKKDESVEPESEFRTFPKVDQQLWHLFEAFEVEAAKRGIQIDLVEAGISGDIRSISEQHVAGQCAYSQNSPGAVTVDREFWANSNGNFQEFIVFHELGHCYLNRGHREDADANGLCISVMRSGLGDCQDAYNSVNREIYIDELFNPDDF